MKFIKNILISCTLILCSFITIGCSNVKNDQEVNSENNYVLEIKNGERFFKSEIIPKSNSEKVILDYFKIQINDEYDEFKNLLEGEQFNSYSEIFKKNFNDGLYTEELTVHSLEVLNEDEYLNDTNGVKYFSYMDRLKEYNPSEFEIIEVNYTNKLTDELNKSAQWGSGNWIRYFVIVKAKEDSNWKIFDVYGHM